MPGMMPAIQGFLLGLANGGSCLTACVPIFLPYLVSEGRSVRHNISPVASFLAGRLAGYLVFAVFAWEAGKWIRTAPLGGLVLGAVYAALACFLVVYGFSAQSASCVARGVRGKLLKLVSQRPVILPLLMGLLTGLTLCPPFMTAVAGAANQTSLGSTLLFFLSFFIATSLYVAPFPFLGLLGRFQAVRIVGRLAAGIMGCYLFYQSLVMIYGGLQS
jgi:sulfite exporter TauE/SafE